MIENKTFEAIVVLIRECVFTLNHRQQNKVDLEKGDEAALFGGEGVLDSLGLVSLVVMVEQAVEDRFGTTLILVSEKAMSRRNSPFATITSLARYIDSLLQEEATA